jgi:uncharacterized membrane protein
MFGLALVLFLLNVVGVLACLIGMIVTAPISLAAMMYAYEDVFGRRGAGAIEVHGVLGGNG